MNEKQRELLKEMREHLAKLHNNWQNDPEFDGHSSDDVIERLKTLV